MKATFTYANILYWKFTTIIQKLDRQRKRVIYKTETKVVHGEYMRQACSAGWKASDQSEDAHHADVSTEEELVGWKRKLRF